MASIKGFASWVAVERHCVIAKILLTWLSSCLQALDWHNLKTEVAELFKDNNSRCLMTV